VFGSRAVNSPLNITHSKVFIGEITSIYGQFAAHLLLKVYKFSLV